MRIKPKTEIISENNYKRFPALYKCFCPNCSIQLKEKLNRCKCGQEIDWSDFL